MQPRSTFPLRAGRDEGMNDSRARPTHITPPGARPTTAITVPAVSGGPPEYAPTREGIKTVRLQASPARCVLHPAPQLGAAHKPGRKPKDRTQHLPLTGLAPSGMTTHGAPRRPAVRPDPAGSPADHRPFGQRSTTFPKRSNTPGATRPTHSTSVTPSWKNAAADPDRIRTHFRYSCCFTDQAALTFPGWRGSSRTSAGTGRCTPPCRSSPR
jgi:hypothetical protein